ncbi:hypothetical protein CSKR_110488 [Clonorchis sinensis]|uniref:Uncharacterized protein n=1 Tax=Clonorchis sinensis TaxID=79923 RepID=A0A3R7F7B9_CLOSI|nr:hypothetical protein CSKR_110488 [Clonorchis sinensis]
MNLLPGRSVVHASRLLLSGLGQPGSISALVLPLGSMAAWCSTFSCLKTSQTRDSAGFQQLEHEAAWCSTFSCLKSSQTRDSAGFQPGGYEVQKETILVTGARWLKWLGRKFADRKVRGSNPTSASDFRCLDLGNLTISQPSCFLLVAWQLSTERVLQPNDYHFLLFCTSYNILSNHADF